MFPNKKGGRAKILKISHCAFTTKIAFDYEIQTKYGGGVVFLS